MSDPLEEVRRAVAARRRADARYRVAVLSAARELELAGVRDSAARLARAAGLTRQSMREQLARWRDEKKGDVEELEKLRDLVNANLARQVVAANPDAEDGFVPPSDGGGAYL